MASFEFSPIADFVVLKFKCPNCGEYNETEALSVPIPDYSAETHHDSCSSEFYEQECPECGQGFEITLNNGIYGGDGEISDIDEDEGVEVEEDYNEDFFDEDFDKEYKTVFFDEHVQETVDILDKIEHLDENSKKLLYRILYANIISSMEAYLSDRLIQKVLSSEENKRKFVENFKDFENIKISIADIYKNTENIELRIKKTLREIIYHHLPRVKNIYKSTLDIDLGNISELMECISIRHDIVHRNGKDKDGNLQNINKEDIVRLASIVSDFIRNIESQFVSK